MKPTYVVLFLFLGLVSSQREVPEQLKCFIKGFFKCKDSLRNLCSEFPDFEDRRPVPIPKNRLNGTCPILGQELPLTEIKYIDLPPCPCQEGNPVSKITAGYEKKWNLWRISIISIFQIFNFSYYYRELLLIFVSHV